MAEWLHVNGALPILDSEPSFSKPHRTLFHLRASPIRRPLESATLHVPLPRNLQSCRSLLRLRIVEPTKADLQTSHQKASFADLLCLSTHATSAPSTSHIPRVALITRSSISPTGSQCLGHASTPIMSLCQNRLQEER